MTKLIFFFITIIYVFSARANECENLDFDACNLLFRDGVRCVWADPDTGSISRVDPDNGVCLEHDDPKIDGAEIIACKDNKKELIDGECGCKREFVSDYEGNCLEKSNGKDNQPKSSNNIADNINGSALIPNELIEKPDIDVSTCIISNSKSDNSLKNSAVWIEKSTEVQPQQIFLTGGQNQGSAQNMAMMEKTCKKLFIEEVTDVFKATYYVESPDCYDFEDDKGKYKTTCSPDQRKDIIEQAAICSKMMGKNSLTQFGHSQGQGDFIPIKANSSIAAGISQPQPSAGASGLGCVGTANAEDYDKCRKAVNSYNTFGIAETAMITAHTLSKQTQRSQLQNEVLESQGNSTVVREAQIRNLRQEYAHNNQLTGLYSTQAGAVLTRAAIGWPTISNLGKKHKSCSDSDQEAACCRLVANYSPREVMPNQGLKGYFAQLTTALSGKILQLQMRNKEIRDQIERLGGDISDLPVSDTGLDTLMTYCQTPEGQEDIEQCAGVNGGPQAQTLGFLGGGSPHAFSATDLSGIGGARSIGDFDKNGDGIIDSDQSTIGNGLQDYDPKSSESGFVDNPRAARFGEGSGPGGGSGSGGGGGGGGSGPGLSQKPRNSEGIKSALSKIEEGGHYGESGSGFYKGSGKKRRGFSKRRDGNKKRRNLGELKGMFGKRSKKKSPVGPKNIAIFDQISDRYEAVKEQGRVRK